MKVIFIEDVPNVAKIGQSKVVADGFARNFLLPRKLAVLADSHAAAAVDAQLKKKMKQRALEEAEMAEVAGKISGLEITIRAKVGENDRLYGSVTGADIARLLTDKAGREIDKRKIELAEPIRQVGTYDVAVRFTHEIGATVKVRVMSEDAVEEPLEKPAEKEATAPVVEEKKAEKAEKAAEKKVKAEKKEAKKPKAAKTEKAEVTDIAVTETKPEKAGKKPRAKSTKKTKAAETATEEGEKKETQPGE
ncbi:MAG: 50S ribosomal protein L9 [Chloroflexi bacterium RBG_16_56_11]|nr:MAG: 50S ribosomal protein L9 [Chloroflexi bacterium RBG_16_56_11]